MKELAQAERRYEADFAFRTLVDWIAHHARTENYTANEIMLAALAASAMVERDRTGDSSG